MINPKLRCVGPPDAWFDRLIVLRLFADLYGVRRAYVPAQWPDRKNPCGLPFPPRKSTRANSTGVQGFLKDKPNETLSKWKYGIIKLAGPLLSITIAGTFAGLYLNKPNVTYQMIYTTASILAMAEIMPVKGLDGYDVREWSRWIYFIAFAVIAVIFFAMNFMQ